MSFGYSRDIFKYPAVQYIPLTLKNSQIKKRKRMSGIRNFSVFNYEERNTLEQRLEVLDYNKEYDYEQDQLAIIVYNYIIDVIMYRGQEVIMVGEESPNTYHLFSVTRKYFYRNNLGFILYDGESSERIANQSFYN